MLLLKAMGRDSLWDRKWLRQSVSIIYMLGCTEWYNHTFACEVACATHEEVWCVRVHAVSSPRACGHS